MFISPLTEDSLLVSCAPSPYKFLMFLVLLLNSMLDSFLDSFISSCNQSCLVSYTANPRISPLGALFNFSDFRTGAYSRGT